MAEEFKIIVEVEDEIDASDKFGIEDRIFDALVEMGLMVNSVKIIW